MGDNGQSAYVYANGIRIHYLNWDVRGDGQPVLMLHGLASNAHIWDFVAPILVQHGLRPLAWDARGHGLTDKPDDGYDFDTITRDLAAFIKACNLEKPVLVGHSWGGHVALNYTASVPFGPFAPLGLVLVDGGITQLDDAPNVTWETIKENLTPPRLAGTPYQSFLNRLHSMETYGQSSEEMMRVREHNFSVYIDEETGEELIAPHLSFEHHMRIVRALWEFQTYERFSRLRCPVLMAPARPAEPASDRDRGYMAYKERGIKAAEENITDLQVRWIEDSVHDIPLQHPQKLADMIVEFCSNL